MEYRRGLVCRVKMMPGREEAEEKKIRQVRQVRYVGRMRMDRTTRADGRQVEG